MKILSKPSDSACALTRPEPRHHHGADRAATLHPCMLALRHDLRRLAQMLDACIGAGAD